MKSNATQSNGRLTRAANACLENADRLLEETYDLEFRRPLATTYYIAVIAQEEAAKAFLLILIRDGLVPMDRGVRRALNDHACKHLVGMILDYMIMHWDTTEELNALISQDLAVADGRLPNDVGSALEILAYEKIDRWKGNHWAWAEDPGYDDGALRIAEGRKDRRKQDALYVRLGSDGQVSSTPMEITEGETKVELETARRYCGFVNSLVEGTDAGIQAKRVGKVMAAMKVVFRAGEPPATTDPA